MRRSRPLDFTRRMKAYELRQLRNGVKPTDMNERWFMFFEDDKLFAHRSWTGTQIYEVSFQIDSDGAALVSGVLVNADPNQYSGDDEGACKLLNDLLDLFSQPGTHAERGASVLESSVQHVPVRDRFRGSLLGLAVGDAIGTTVEFKAPGSFPPVTDMMGGGPFDLPVGAWTDDTSMALCLAESLVERKTFDPTDQLERYVRWYRDGYLSSTGNCFDIGNATRTALEKFERTREPYPGDHAPDAAGNGVLMSLAPVPLAYARRSTQAIRFVSASARTTHGSPQARDACRYFAGLLIGAIHGTHVSALLHNGAFEPVAGMWVAEPLDDEVAAVAGGSFNRSPPAIKGDGYVVAALEAALWALHSTRTFEDGVLAAVNLGNDADTTAAIFGQLAGAYYGIQGIPKRWREKVLNAELILRLADRLYVLASSI